MDAYCYGEKIENQLIDIKDILNWSLYGKEIERNKSYWLIDHSAGE